MDKRNYSFMWVMAINIMSFTTIVKASNLFPEPYCGFRSSTKPWAYPTTGPFRPCSFTASDVESCEATEYVDADIKCLWKNDSCQTTSAFGAGQESCSDRNRETCESGPSFAVGINQCQWHVPDPWTEVAFAPFCGFPHDDEPWTYPYNYCAEYSTTFEHCQRQTIAGIIGCQWDDGMCQSIRNKSGTPCDVVRTEELCLRTNYFAVENCEWKVASTPVPSASPSLSTAPSISQSPSFSMQPSLSDVPTVSDMPSISVAPSVSFLPTDSQVPSTSPTIAASHNPSNPPTPRPTRPPTPVPTRSPTNPPTPSPTSTAPTLRPTILRRTRAPTREPTPMPTLHPTVIVRRTRAPTVEPTPMPTLHPTSSPVRFHSSVEPPTTTTTSPTTMPSTRPTAMPSMPPSVQPTTVPTSSPTLAPSISLTLYPTVSNERDDDGGGNFVWQGIGLAMGGGLGVGLCCWCAWNKKKADAEAGQQTVSVDDANVV